MYTYVARSVLYIADITSEWSLCSVSDIRKSQSCFQLNYIYRLKRTVKL